MLPYKRCIGNYISNKGTKMLTYKKVQWLIYLFFNQVYCQHLLHGMAVLCITVFAPDRILPPFIFTQTAVITFKIKVHNSTALIKRYSNNIEMI